MIELLSNLPSEVVGLAASGRVTADDYESVVFPAIESRLKEHAKIRILYQIGPKFSGFTAGAMWDDAKVGLAHLSAWEKIAVVTDVDWIRTAVGIFKFVIPCPAKLFSNAQFTEASDWVAA
jgi:SpoIIAA-like